MRGLGLRTRSSNERRLAVLGEPGVVGEEGHNARRGPQVVVRVGRLLLCQQILERAVLVALVRVATGLADERRLELAADLQAAR